MKAIPVPVRERILKLYDQGQGTVEIAASFGYCVAAVRRGRQRFKERGTLEPQTHRCGRKTHLTESRKERRRCWRSFLTIPKETRQRGATSTRVPFSLS